MSPDSVLHESTKHAILLVYGIGVAPRHCSHGHELRGTNIVCRQPGVTRGSMQGLSLKLLHPASRRGTWQRHLLTGYPKKHCLTCAVGKCGSLAQNRCVPGFFMATQGQSLLLQLCMHCKLEHATSWCVELGDWRLVQAYTGHESHRLGEAMFGCNCMWYPMQNLFALAQLHPHKVLGSSVVDPSQLCADMT